MATTKGPEGGDIHQELAALAPVLSSLGYTLDAAQPHISGERFLLSPEKWVLAGTNAQGGRVIIKTSTAPNGIAEITQEKNARDLLARLSFANDTLLAAREEYFGSQNGRIFFITEFIPQEKIFVDYPLEEQFFLALRAFEAQEAFHATTYEHLREVAKVFEATSPADYEKLLSQFRTSIEAVVEYPHLSGLLTQAQELVHNSAPTLDRYSNYLTHTDFVPHNMRIHNRAIYVLDQTAFRFANKYEGWARFLNYMVVHNPALERLLVEHLAKNRASELEDLRVMRVFKAIFLLQYYACALQKTEGDLHALTQVRVHLWANVLEHLLGGTAVLLELVDTYKKERNALRSEEEKHRQRDFAEA